MVWLNIPKNHIKFEIILKTTWYIKLFSREIIGFKFFFKEDFFFVKIIYETFDFPWCVFQSLQGRGHSYNPDYLIWKPMQKQITPREHGIAWVE